MTAGVPSCPSRCRREARLVARGLFGSSRGRSGSPSTPPSPTAGRDARDAPRPWPQVQSRGGGRVRAGSGRGVRARLPRPCAVRGRLRRALGREGQPAGGLQGAIDRIVDRPAFAGAFWGIECAASSPQGPVRPQRAQEPEAASTLKLVTTPTRPRRAGPVCPHAHTPSRPRRPRRHGPHPGDVYLVGAETRRWTHRALQQMAEAPQSLGLRRIEGRLVGHEGLFSGDRRGADWAWAPRLALRGRGLCPHLHDTPPPSSPFRPESARATR